MIIADLQIHSKHSRATSKNISFSNLEKYARIKGLNLLGTGDFQHPLQFKSINEELEEDDNGILWSKTKFPFLWQTEISLMYTQDGKGRRIHHLIFAPNKDVAKKIIDELGRKGRLDYDGRPIFGFSSIELVDMMNNIDSKIEIIPAHCMTPWFGLFGSKSGFDSLKDCFKEKVDKIHAVETGMSADPPMLWRLKEDVNLVSFSDAHSYWPWRLGREATVFDTELSYDSIIKAIRTGVGLNSTIETVPDYGKYHYDGHRNCGFSCNPKESKKLNGICPECEKSLTLGVEYRIDELAKVEDGFRPEKAKEFFDVIPLHELIAVVYNTKQLSSKKVWDIYDGLIKGFGNELNVLLKANFDDLKKIVHEKLAKVILLNREGRLRIKAGFDGEYGKVVLFKDETVEEQKSLSEF